MSARKQYVLIGKESSGKSQLVAALTGGSAHSSNVRGSTVNNERYEGNGFVLVDTPGILRQSDTLTTRTALSELNRSDAILLVVQATCLDDDLDDLLPLVRTKRGVVVATFWDKVWNTDRANEALDRLSQAASLPVVPIDARNVSAEQRSSLLDRLAEPKPFPGEQLRVRAGWRIEPPPTVLELPYLGPFIAAFLLLLPAIAAVWAANTFAGRVDPLIQSLIAPLVDRLSALPAPASNVLIGDYGLLVMGPLLLVWAVPTVVLYALLLGVYKASGLLDRVTVALHHVMRPFGLSGRDLTRVVMGFGCNVPAVVSTRACSSCSRGSCISAIAFGSACSYQLGATIAVFGAAGLPYLVIPYLLVLISSTLIYTRLVAPAEARSSTNLLMLDRRAFLEWPRWPGIWREARGMLVHFFKNALPIFFVITIVASMLDWLGVINLLAGGLAPLMMLFNLPAESALPVMLASVRKDGILLFAEEGTVTTLTAVQLLTGVYLASVLVPCLVTALTISREQSPAFALKLIGKQALAASCFTAILAWSSAFVL
jgi:Fe2+ transport system protein B